MAFKRGEGEKGAALTLTREGWVSPFDLLESVADVDARDLGGDFLNGITNVCVFARV